MLDVNKATKELKEKSMEDIEAMTAEAWGSRAVASYEMVGNEQDAQTRFRRFYEGENFRQEAFEHASMADETGEKLNEVREEILEAREEALGMLEGRMEETPRAGGGRRG